MGFIKVSISNFSMLNNGLTLCTSVASELSSVSNAQVRIVDLVFTSGTSCLDSFLQYYVSPIVSFVRSISMDTWQDEQVRRMQVSSVYFV